MQNRIHILSTRPLNAMLIEEAEQEGVNIECLSFIETEPIRTVDVQQEIEQALLQKTTVVFTSMNAVEAVALYQDESQPAWNIYCIGNATMKLVSRYFGDENISGIAGDAASLAELIVEDNFTDEVIFFCGDQRRDELPRILREHDIEVNEVIVYQTIIVPHKTDRPWHGILFFSPNAVRSFFQNNKLQNGTVLFAVGKTTANEIRKHSINKIITADEPGKEYLVKKMIEYFT